MSEMPLLNDGVIRFWSQRPKPFTNCMFASVCVVLTYMGYDLPDDFVDQLRDASEVDPEKPTGTADTRRALKKLIPNCPIKFGTLDERRLLKRIESGEIVARIMVHVGPDIANHLTTHFRPTFHGGHAVAITTAQELADGDFAVTWMDPMGVPRKKYKGEPAKWSEFSGAVRRSNGKVQVTFGVHNAALTQPVANVDVGGGGMGFPDGPMPAPPFPEFPLPDSVELVNRRANDFGNIGQGTPLLDPDTMETVLTVQDTADFQVVGETPDGVFAAVQVMTEQLPNTDGQTTLLVVRDMVSPPLFR